MTENTEYFDAYEDIRIHQLMVADLPRTLSYKDAIYKNEHIFKGKVVMDVGAGTGILSLFMAKAGAKKVYSVEASALAKTIPTVARDNGFEDIIETVHSKVEDFVLPEGEKVDVIVSEWMGFYLVHESMLESVLFARDKFLSEDGVLFPSEAKLYACPCSLEKLYKDQINYWDDVQGFNLSAVRKLAIKSKLFEPEITEISSSDLLADPVCIHHFNLRYMNPEEVKEFSSTSFVGINKSGNFQGVAVWFDCLFDGRDYDENGEEFGALITLSTSPSSPVTHWQQTVIIFGNMYSENIAKEKSDFQDASPDRINSMNYLEENEVIGWNLKFTQLETNKRHYNIYLELVDSELTNHPIPCSCPMPRCQIIAKMIEKVEIMDQDDSNNDSSE